MIEFPVTEKQGIARQCIAMIDFSGVNTQRQRRETAGLTDLTGEFFHWSVAESPQSQNSLCVKQGISVGDYLLSGECGFPISC
jgi:hypothetical protein